MGIILFIVSLILSVVFLPFGFLWTMASLVGRVKFKTFCMRVNSWFLVMAISVDQFCNVVMQDMLNAIMIKRDGYKFGSEDETLSSVYGKNYRDGTLTTFGKCISTVLNFLDDNHVIKSIEEDEVNTNKK